MESAQKMRTDNRAIVMKQPQALSLAEGPMNDESLFAEAVAIKAEARAAFLDLHCKGNVELRKHVEALLRANDHPDPFLEPVWETAWREVQVLLDEVVQHLSDKYREPLPPQRAKLLGRRPPTGGIIFQASKTRVSDISRGTSPTFLLGERYLNPDNYETGSDAARL